MKRLIIILSLAAAICGTPSCSRQEEDSLDPGMGDGRVMVDFTSGLTGQVTSRASDGNWADGDRVGIYMKKNGEPLSASSVQLNTNNIEYSVSSSGVMTPVSRTIYYPNSSHDVDFIAYYPYKSGLEDFIYPVSLYGQGSEGADLADFDLLYSNNQSGLNRNTSSVELGFSHMLAKVTINLLPGNGTVSGDLQNLNVSFHNIPAEADFSLIDGSFTVTYTGGPLISELFASSNSATLFLLPVPHVGSSLIIARYGEGGLDFAVTWHISDSIVFESGNHYTFDVRINKSSTRSADSFVADGELISVEKI